MINITADQWIRVDRQLPKLNQPVLVCDIFPGEKNRAHLLSFTGKPSKEWRNDLSGDVYSQEQFTYWIPLQIEFPAFTPEQEISAFQETLNTAAPGVHFEVDLSRTLSEVYVRSQIMERARIDQLGHDVQLASNGQTLIIQFFKE